MYDDEKKFLEHWGILGMKWGVRRDRATLARLRKQKDPDSEDYKKAAPLKKRSINSLSNAELKSLNERLNLERQFKDLKKQSMSSGQKFVSEILKTSSKAVLTQLVTKGLSEAVDAAVKASKKK